MASRLGRSGWAALAIVALVAGLAAGIGLRRGEPPRGVAAQQALTSAEFLDLEGKTTTLAAWDGRVRVVNFWATWCLPCREEIPLFVDVSKRSGDKGPVIVGIAIDSVDKVVPFARDFAINYPLLIGNAATIELMKSLGNLIGGLPYTIILDRDGKVVDRHLGLVKEQDLTRKLAALAR